MKGFITPSVPFAERWIITMNIYAEVSEAKKKQSMETLSEKLDLF